MRCLIHNYGLQQVPIFYKHNSDDNDPNVIGLRIFALPEGRACIVSWNTPEPAMQAFVPNVERPDATAMAVPYALFLLQSLNAHRVTVELDPDMEWDAQWGELRELLYH